jgi:hypothetical protein
MRIRRRNWIIKRIALGFAVAALVAPAAAQARVDEGIKGQPNKASEAQYIPFVTDFPSYASNSVQDVVRDWPGVTPGSYSNVEATDYGMPRAMPSDYAAQRGDQIEILRTQPRSTQGYLLRRDGNAVDTNPVLHSSDLIENTRLAPRGSGEIVASSGFDWGVAGIAAGIVAAILVLGGMAVRATRQVGKAQTA